MVELDQYKFTLNQYKEPMEELRLSLDLDKKEKTIQELEAEMEAGDFWSDPEKAQDIMKRVKGLKDTMASYTELTEAMEDISTMIEMGNEENDASLIPEIKEMLDAFEASFDKMKIQTLFSGEYDSDNAIVTLHAGAGGTESCDWAGMLYRMYTKWAESHGFKTEVLDYLDGDEAGIKSITFEVNGENAFGYLKSEKGVHRLGVSLHLMRQERGRLPLLPVTLCRILKRICLWRLPMRTFESILIAPAEPAVSISTRLIRPSELPIFLQAW